MANRRSSADLRIIFMGTPEFAVASLDAMLNAGMKIVCVITAPDKPAGRGMKMTESAVKQYAVANGLPVLQPEKLKAPEFIQSLRSLNADLQVVVAFRMLQGLVSGPLMPLSQTLLMASYPRQKVGMALWNIWNAMRSCALIHSY